MRKWTYDSDGICPTLSSSYTYNSTTAIPTQTTTAHNGEWICLYVNDAAGNYRTLASANDINITPPDTTAPVTSINPNGASCTASTASVTLTCDDGAGV